VNCKIGERINRQMLLHVNDVEYAEEAQAPMAQSACYSPNHLLYYYILTDWYTYYKELYLLVIWITRATKCNYPRG